MADDIYYFVIIEMQKWRVLYYTLAGVRRYQYAVSGLALAFRRKWWMAIVTILFDNLSII